MPVNEFEKKVQQKMDDLQLRPSTTVWEEVEKRIRKEKKRRRIIFWFFIFGALLLGGAGWWIMDMNKKHTQSPEQMVQHSNITSTNDTSTAKNNESKTQGQTTNEITTTEKILSETEKKLPIEEKTAAQKIIGLKNQKTSDNSVKYSYQGKIAINVQSAGKTKKLKAVDSKGQSQEDNTDKTIVVATIHPEPLNKTAPQTSSNIKADQKINEPIVKNINDKIIGASTDSIKRDITATDNTDSLSEKETTQTSKPDPIKLKKKKWELGITGGIGSSGTAEGISFFGGQKSMYDRFSQVNTPGSGSGPIIITPPLLPQKGFSWELGIYAKKSLSKRIAFSTGLSFISYSTVQRTGAFVDSSRTVTNNFTSSYVSGFYRNGTAASHKNHYYFLQIPFSIQWQLNKSNKFPILFQNGVAFNLLAGSDALLYNSSSNVFYKDNKLLNKIQLSYQTGLYTNLFQKSKHPISAGVFFKYHFITLQKIATSNNHLNSFGIQLGWRIKK